MGKNPDGTLKYHRETFHGTKTQAQKRLTELLREIDTGGYVQPLKDSLAAYLSRWLEEVKIDLKPTTVHHYTYSVERISEKIGHIPLQELRPLDLKTFYRWALREGRADGKGGLSRDTVRGFHRTIRKALQDAVDWGLVARNVATAVKPPRVRAKSRNVWTKEEAKQFLEAAAKTRVFALYSLALTTGLRRGELFGLRWQDVDLDRRILQVAQTIVVVNGKLIIQSVDDEYYDDYDDYYDDDPGKTDAAETPLEISQRVADILRVHRAEQNAIRLSMGPKYNNQDLIFAQLNGNPLRPDQFTKRDFPLLCKKAGVRRIRFHDLRHTYATSLLLDKTPLKVVQERMRHADPATTLRMYSHLTKEAVSESAAAMDAVIPDDV